MNSAERSSKNQIDGVLLVEYLFTHIVKYGVIILKEIAHVARKKKNPWFRSHILSKVWTYLPQKTRVQNNGNRLNILYWYKAIVRCKHLDARILQHEFKFSSWLKATKISNQIVHHHSATKFASMLQLDIKKLQACKTVFLILRKKKKTITNICTHVNTNWLIIPIFNTVIEKKTECEDRRVAGNLSKAL